MKWCYFLILCIGVQPASAACLTPRQIIVDALGDNPWAVARIAAEFDQELNSLREVAPQSVAAVVASFDRIVERGQPTMVGVELIAERGTCAYRVTVNLGWLNIDLLGPKIYRKP